VIVKACNNCGGYGNHPPNFACLGPTYEWTPINHDPADVAEIARLRAELEELRDHVDTWICERCNMAYPSEDVRQPPLLPACPRCGLYVVLKYVLETRRLKDEIANLSHRNELLQRVVEKLTSEIDSLQRNTVPTKYHDQINEAVILDALKLKAVLSKPKELDAVFVEEDSLLFRLRIASGYDQRLTLDEAYAALYWEEE
jgi:hypothetical protein